jgi:hypothetical protein
VDGSARKSNAYAGGTRSVIDSEKRATATRQVCLSPTQGSLDRTRVRQLHDRTCRHPAQIPQPCCSRASGCRSLPRHALSFCQSSTPGLKLREQGGRPAAESDSVKSVSYTCTHHAFTCTILG